MASILFLTQALPYPLDAGPKVRAYYVLRHLTQRHDVTLVSFMRTEDTPEHIEHLRTICGHVHTVPMRRSVWRTARAAIAALSSGRPLLIERNHSQEMLAALRSLTTARRFDHVHADQTSMVQYALAASDMIQANANARPHLALDAHNALFKVVERLAAQKRNPAGRRLLYHEAHRLWRYEAHSYRCFDGVVFVTEKDRQQIGLPMRAPSLSAAIQLRRPWRPALQHYSWRSVYPAWDAIYPDDPLQ